MIFTLSFSREKLSTDTRKIPSKTFLGFLVHIWLRDLLLAAKLEKRKLSLAFIFLLCLRRFGKAVFLFCRFSTTPTQMTAPSRSSSSLPQTTLVGKLTLAEFLQQKKNPFPINTLSPAPFSSGSAAFPPTELQMETTNPPVGSSSACKNSTFPASHPETLTSTKELHFFACDCHRSEFFSATTTDLQSNR